MLGTPKRRLLAELRLLAGNRGLPGWVRPIAQGDVTALRGLGDALRDWCRRTSASEYGPSVLHTLTPLGAALLEGRA
jgi:hypothetical protein